MKVIDRRKLAWCLLVVGLGVGMVNVPARAQSPSPPQPPQPQAPPPLDGPVTGLEALPSTEAPQAGAAERESPAPARSGEVLPADGSPAGTGRVHVPQAPPAPIAERPSGERPDARAQWISGHWDWDQSRSEFVWVAGSWQIPPAGMVWVAGRWMRDPDGWYYLPGSWSRRDRLAGVANRNRAAWRTTGPPADHPDDTPGLAPSPDSFFVPGHYAPSGDRLVWIPGAWARVQPGWDWIPARWVRRPDGWDFREGSWVRDPSTVVVTTRPRRRFAARPGTYSRPSVIIESETRVAGPDAASDRPPPPPYALTPSDPIAEAEAAGRLAGSSTTVVTEFPPVLIGPVTGMPYYVIRPPGAYPYGPGGVVVPGAVPPFVRRMLDRILP